MFISKENQLILEAIYTPVLVIDHQGIIIFANHSYEKMTDLKVADIIGKKLKDVRPDSRLTEVLTLKHPLLTIRREVNEKEFFTNLVPIISDDKVLGALSSSIESTDLKLYKDRLERSEDTIKQLKNKVYATKYNFESIKGDSPALHATIRMAKKMAKKDTTVLIQGESGTGKELFAQSIHSSSERHEAPFIPINCASLNTEMLESELFGYTSGSFTGANKEGKNGVFLEAKGGTVFLDEISEMDLSVQTKLLRVFQEHTIRPLGSSKEIPIDVRIICASNRNLDGLVKAKKFKHDLFFRLATFTLNIPALRERREDILPLANFFLERQGNTMTMDNNFEKFLLEYEWPGNIRELQNVIEYCSVMTTNDQLSTDLLPKYLAGNTLFHQQIDQEEPIVPLKQFIKQKEADYIEAVLKINGHDSFGKKKTAQQLGISLATLYNKLDLK